MACCSLCSSFCFLFFFFSSRRRHTRFDCDWSSDVCSSDLGTAIVAVKVLDQNEQFCCTSDVVAALDYVITSHPEVKVVNMSLGTNARFAGTCDTATSFTMAFASAIDTLRARGTLTFVSSGNDGSPSTLEAPACVAKIGRASCRERV